MNLLSQSRVSPTRSHERDGVGNSLNPPQKYEEATHIPQTERNKRAAEKVAV